MIGEKAKQALSVGLSVCLGLGAGAALADDYTAGFYTRGSEAAFYLDTGDPYFAPFYLPVRRLAAIPRVTISASREDNLFMDANRGTDSTIIDLVPGITLIWGRPEGRHVYVDYGSIIRVYDSSDRLERKPSHLLAFGGVYRTARSQASGRIGYRRIENADTVTGARVVKQDYILNLAMDRRVSVKTSIGLLANLERHDFDALQYVDYDRYYGGVRLYYDVTPRSQVFLQGGVGHDDLDSGPDGYGDADFYDLAIGMRGKPSPKTSVAGRAGYLWRTYQDDSIHDVEHWIAAIQGDVTPFGFTIFWAGVNADIRPAIRAAGSTTIDQRLTTGLRRRIISDNLLGQGSVFAGRIDYRGPDSLLDRRRDDYWGYSLALDWWTRHNLSGGVAYSYIENRAFLGADAALQRDNAYEAGRWTLRMSWNY